MLNCLFGTRRATSSKIRLNCENLEERCNPTGPGGGGGPPAGDFIVNISADTPDANIGDGFARDAQGNTSLRSVIQETNAPGNVRVGDWNTLKWTVGFAVPGNVVTLTSALPELTSNFQFNGDGVTIERDANAGAFFRLFVIKAGTESRFYSITFRGGWEVGDGGAINNKGKLWVEDCNFTDNQSIQFNGGAIFSGDTATYLTIIGCSFWLNSAFKTGGAISAIDETNVFISNTDIFSNDVTANWNGIDLFRGLGGGVYLHTYEAEFAPLIQDTRIYDNWASNYGGGVYVDSTYFTMVGGEIHGNTASTGDGGGIFIDAAGKTVTLNAVALTANEAGEKGGGAYIENGNLTLEDLTAFTDNTAMSYAGAAYKKNQATVTVIHPPAGAQAVEEDP